jgi:hypothetical protein
LGDLAKEVLGWVEKGMAEDDDARPFLMASGHGDRPLLSSHCTLEHGFPC